MSSCTTRTSRTSTRDVNVRQLLLYTGGLVFTCVICALVVGGLFKLFESQAAANDPVVSPLAAPAGQLPPEPRLLTDEPSMLKKQRALEAETLEHYGWVDQKGGIARLPIAEAKKKLLHDGLPFTHGWRRRCLVGYVGRCRRGILGWPQRSRCAVTSRISRF